MQRDFATDSLKKIGEEVQLFGWAHNVREMGQDLVFIDFRDNTGILQVVAGDELADKAQSINPEYAIRIKGNVKERPDNQKNEGMKTGTVEVEAIDIEIVNDSEVPPFVLNKDEVDANEDLRLEYRYLDLRRQQLQNNISMRHETVKFIRKHLWDKDFKEIETPILTGPTPEGARDYLVPSRIHKGKFYALPQSPQQYKQLLMVGGFDKYFQIAKSMRDEDTRGDRQPEFTQLDLEMSFTSQEEVMQLTENLFTKLVEELYPGKEIKETPWPRLTYEEAMKKYDSDKPDLRDNPEDPDELAFAWVVDFPLFESEEGELTPMHHPFTAPNPDDVDKLNNKPSEAKSIAYDMVLNGYEVGGGSMRIHDPELQLKIFDILGIDEQEARQKFGHLLEAFTYGAPPHGGIALGLDRLMMILQEEESIREVMAFPKTNEARDPMMDVPTEIDQQKLDELGITIDTEEDE